MGEITLSAPRWAYVWIGYFNNPPIYNIERILLFWIPIPFMFLQCIKSSEYIHGAVILLIRNAGMGAHYRDAMLDLPTSVTEQLRRAYNVDISECATIHRPHVK